MAAESNELTSLILRGQENLQNIVNLLVEGKFGAEPHNSTDVGIAPGRGCRYALIREAFRLVSSVRTSKEHCQTERVRPGAFQLLLATG